MLKGDVRVGRNLSPLSRLSAHHLIVECDVIAATATVVQGRACVDERKSRGLKWS